MLGLLGPNGAGKTTAIRDLACDPMQPNLETSSFKVRGKFEHPSAAASETSSLTHSRSFQLPSACFLLLLLFSRFPFPIQGCITGEEAPTEGTVCISEVSSRAWIGLCPQAGMFSPLPHAMHEFNDVVNVASRGDRDQWILGRILCFFCACKT